MTAIDLGQFRQCVQGQCSFMFEEIMSRSKLLTCRRPQSARRWAVAVTMAMMMPSVGGQLLVPTVHAQSTAQVGAPRVMTPATGQTIVNQFDPTVGDTYWVQRTTNAVGAAGTGVTIRSTYGATMPDRRNLAVIEIRRQ
jgi:hypothetical protein